MASNGIVLGLAGLAFCCWAVSLGGLAALQDQCGGNFHGLGTYTGVQCEKAFRWEWFIICFQLVVSVGVMATTAMGALPKTRQAWLALTAMVTLLYYFLADRYLAASDRNEIGSGDLSDRIKTMTAGTIMVSAVNSLLVIALGLQEEAPSAAVEGKAAAAV